RAQPFGMLEQDFFRYERRREHGSVSERADRLDARRERALRFLETVLAPLARRDGSVEYVATFAAEVAGQRRDDAHQVRDERGKRRQLDSEIPEYRCRLGAGEVFGNREDCSGIETRA